LILVLSLRCGLEPGVRRREPGKKKLAIFIPAPGSRPLAPVLENTHVPAVFPADTASRLEPQRRCERNDIRGRNRDASLKASAHSADAEVLVRAKFQRHLCAPPNTRAAPHSISGRAPDRRLPA